MQPKYCLPIITNTQQDAVAAIEKNQGAYGFFEIWLDYLTDPTPEFIARLAEKWPGRIIVLLRRQNLEPIRMPLEERLRLIDSFARLPVTLDLDISQKEELQHVASLPKRMPLITSYHNYEKTPASSTLGRIVQKMRLHQPDIFKVAAFCHSPADAVRLLQLQAQLLKAGKRHIVLGMGPHGAATRIFGTLWGNELIFAPLSTSSQSAPGQLTRAQLERIFSELAT